MRQAVIQASLNSITVAGVTLMVVMKNYMQRLEKEGIYHYQQKKNSDIIKVLLNNSGSELQK